MVSRSVPRLRLIPLDHAGLIKGHKTPSGDLFEHIQTQPMVVQRTRHNSPSSQTPSRRRRTPMACRYCRFRKVKCEPVGGRSQPCIKCQKKGNSCVYEPVRVVPSPAASSSTAPQFPPSTLSTAVFAPSNEADHGHALNPSSHSGASQLFSKNQPSYPFEMQNTTLQSTNSNVIPQYNPFATQDPATLTYDATVANAVSASFSWQNQAPNIQNENYQWGMPWTAPHGFLNAIPQDATFIGQNNSFPQRTQDTALFYAVADDSGFGDQYGTVVQPGAQDTASSEESSTLYQNSYSNVNEGL